MAGDSNVGSRSLYQADDQRHSPQSEKRESLRNREHPPQSSRRGSQHHKEQEELKRGSMPSDDDLHKMDPLAPVSNSAVKSKRDAVGD